MAQSRSLNLRRPAAHEEVHRVYAVNSECPSRQGRCVLDDGSAVVHAFETVATALRATANDPNLRLVRHRALNADEQERVEKALLA
ncbi:MAG: hypothetical protein BRD30_07825 [Bacteroidetes bacterium QH_2_63_10]|nr:MAG: hypothetical protein BRD30_07825 [Bacteroidetes bacterium QH_2_63_10]